VTNDLERRLLEHRQGVFPSFSKKYNIHQLVYFEETGSIEGAILREKELKGWSRAKKVSLIESLNPEWADLSVTMLGLEDRPVSGTHPTLAVPTSRDSSPSPLANGSE